VTEGSGFDDVTAVRPDGEGRFLADIVEGWDVRGNPHGGYLLALVTAAMGRVVAQPDPLSVSASYLAPPSFGPAELEVRVLRAGSRQSTAAVRLVQDGVTRVDAVATFGTLTAEPPHLFAGDLTVPCPLPAPEACPLISDLRDPTEEGVRLHEHLELRMHPGTGWLRGEPRGVPEVHGWMRHVGRDPDSLAVLMFSDGMPPSLYEAMGRQGVHTPTVQLTTHLFARPAPGWVRGTFRTRLMAGGFLDQDGDLFDEAGTLVATTRQLGLIRTWEH
jgi:acyl-CoA thioesterase